MLQLLFYSPLHCGLVQIWRALHNTHCYPIYFKNTIMSFSFFSTISSSFLLRTVVWRACKRFGAQIKISSLCPLHYSWCHTIGNMCALAITIKYSFKLHCTAEQTQSKCNCQSLSSFIICIYYFANHVITYMGHTKHDNGFSSLWCYTNL